MTISADTFAKVNPSVIGAGGSGLVLNGLMLTNDRSIPIGTVSPFPSYDSVVAWYGETSTEASLAEIYFSGWDESTIKPGRLLFAQYPAAPVAAYLRSASLSGMTLAQLQALTGVLTVVVDGVSKTSSTINLSAATSFSNAATLIAAAFTSGPAVTYDALRSAFVITSTTTGAASTIGYASGSLAAPLFLTLASGAVTSQGAVAGTPATIMAQVKAATQNWAAFMTTFEPVTADKLAFSAWTSSQNGRFVYWGWDTDVAATQAGNTTSWGAQLQLNNFSGSVPVHQSPSVAAFGLGVTASIDFTRTNARITYKFKGLAGLVPTVTDDVTAQNLTDNGYNFYGAYATANDGFEFFSPGQISGPYDWIDEYVNAIWLNSQFQLAMVDLLTQIPSIPYNAAGDALIEAALSDPITAALNFGAIRSGVQLSNLQKAEVNNAAGTTIDDVLFAKGVYVQVQASTTSAEVRGLRGSPPLTVWYCDGGSVQSLVLASIVIQ